MSYLDNEYCKICKMRTIASLLLQKLFLEKFCNIMTYIKKYVKEKVKFH